LVVFQLLRRKKEEDKGEQVKEEKKRKEKKRKFSLEADEVCSYTHFAHRFAIVIGC
jgi:hypothetical protein